MADNEPTVRSEAQRSMLSRVAAVTGAVALFFADASLRLGFVFAPIFASLLDESALSQTGLGSPDIPEPLGSTLTDIRAWVLGFSLLWWGVVGLWWIFSYPQDPDHHDFEWYAIHAAFPVLGLYVWALAPTVVAILVSSWS